MKIADIKINIIEKSNYKEKEKITQKLLSPTSTPTPS